MFDVCLHFTGLQSLVNNDCPTLPSHFSLSHLLTSLWFSSLYRLPHLSVSASLDSFVLLFFTLIFLAWKCAPWFSAASWILPPFVSFVCLPSAIRPRQRAGTIQRWQNCTKHWVSEETIKAPSESCSFAQHPHWAAAAPAVRHHWASALKSLSHSSLRALYFKHLRDYISTVINLRGPICQRCDCFLLSL